LDEHQNYQTRDIYRFVASGSDADGRVVGELQLTGAIPAFSTEPSSLGIGDRVQLTRDLFSVVRQES
jgi:hypothetical protein